MTEKEKNDILKYLYKLKSYGYQYHESIEYLNANINLNISEIEHCSLCNAHKLATKKDIAFGDSNSNLIVVNTNKISDADHFNLLKKMIEKVLLIKFESIYMLNIVKCNLNNNEVKTEYINQCMPFIKKQLNEVNENAVFLFIGDAYLYLTSSYTMEVKSSKIIDYNGQKGLIIPSLEYIQRNPSSKTDIFEGLKRLKIFLEK